MLPSGGENRLARRLGLEPQLEVPQTLASTSTTLQAPAPHAQERGRGPSIMDMTVYGSARAAVSASSVRLRPIYWELRGGDSGR